ncbi:MAG: DUF86 domain-containing protein [Candidatus Omnitrophica bacterium]|nr:DUF86 domain-containing protein [Candidatus Omnitrophota bacterium]
MIDYKIIAPKLENLKQYVTYLKDYKKHPLEDLKKDHTLSGAVLRYLQLAIEASLDMGEMLISGLNLKKPEEARQIILILAEAEIIPKDFGQRFAPVAGLRNILVHEYAEIDLARIHNYLQNNLADFDLFARKVAQFLKENNK